MFLAVMNVTWLVLKTAIAKNLFMYLNFFTKLNKLYLNIKKKKKKKIYLCILISLPS